MAMRNVGVEDKIHPNILDEGVERTPLLLKMRDLVKCEQDTIYKMYQKKSVQVVKRLKQHDKEVEELMNKRQELNKAVLEELGVDEEDDAMTEWKKRHAVALEKLLGAIKEYEYNISN